MAEIRGNLELTREKTLSKTHTQMKRKRERNSFLVNPMEKVNEEGNGV
jgi:hypothetical protein